MPTTLSTLIASFCMSLAVLLAWGWFYWTVRGFHRQIWAVSRSTAVIYFSPIFLNVVISSVLMSSNWQEHPVVGTAIGLAYLGMLHSGARLCRLKVCEWAGVEVEKGVLSGRFDQAYFGYAVSGTPAHIAHQLRYATSNALVDGKPSDFRLAVVLLARVDKNIPPAALDRMACARIRFMIEHRILNQLDAATQGGEAVKSLGAMCFWDGFLDGAMEQALEKDPEALASRKAEWQEILDQPNVAALVHRAKGFLEGAAVIEKVIQEGAPAEG